MKENQPLSKGRRGGARPGAGRKPGSKNQRSREIADRAMAEGITPLEYLLALMRAPADHEDPKVQVAREAMRFEAAKAAAPYCHPRLQAIERSGSIDTTARMTDAELDAAIAEGVARLGTGTASGCKPVSSALSSVAIQAGIQENDGLKDAASAKPPASMRVAGALMRVSASASAVAQVKQSQEQVKDSVKAESPLGRRPTQPITFHAKPRGPNQMPDRGIERKT